MNWNPNSPIFDSPIFWALLNLAIAVGMGLGFSPYSAIPNGLVAAFYIAYYLRN